MLDDRHQTQVHLASRSAEIPCRPRRKAPGGFALIATLMLMVLITVIATGLLGLASIELRKSTTGEARAAAMENARLGLMLALGQLQKDLGDDRRITADASILGSSARPHLVGVWESWNPGFTLNPSQAVASTFYDSAKDSRFQGWLVSDPEPERTGDRNLANQASTADAVKVFRIQSDGFDIDAPRVPVPGGAYAWAVSQEGTKAKINVGGPENGKRNPNDDIVAQARPGLGLSEIFKQPPGDWEWRAARVISTGQAGLDATLADNGSVPAVAWRDYTAHSMGLLTDVVKGGLKVDLNLGFEMSDNDFERNTLGDFPSPFRAAAAGFSVSNNYKNQRPLYRPNTASATHTARLDQFEAARVLFDYPGAGVPTFHTLRSFYRIPHHLYTAGQDGLTVFERHADHVAFARSGSVPSGLFRTPWETPPAQTTQSSIRPIVDRVMFLLSTGLTAAQEPALVITPVVTMWNPYNVSLEIEGAVAYPWLDVPFNLNFIVYNASGTALRNHSHGMAGLLGRQLKSMNNHGRSVDPYLYAAITANGSRITGNAAPIRFQPGEIRVFVPTDRTPALFQPMDYGSPSATVSIAGITTYLRPVESLSDFKVAGGLAARLSETKMQSGESAEMHFTIATGDDYPCFISVEDATRAKGTSATTAVKGQAFVDVLQRYFGLSGEFGHNNSGRSTGFRSVRKTYSSLVNEPAPFAALEFYHRYARTGEEQSADLVYTGNPRQPWMAQYMTNGTFPSGPQYKLRVRGPLNTFDDVIDTADGGRRAFYGPSNRAGAGGVSQLSFFEIPRAPMLSLAAFQHADLSSTPFGPANQFANSWASAYVARNRTLVAQTGSGESARPPVYDTVYLANEALWDGFFFSGAAPVLSHSSGSGRPGVWSSPTASSSRSLARVIEDFVRNPAENPLRNPRMRLVKGHLPEESLAADLLRPEGCMKIAGHLMVDGAFNVNSTSIEAWTALLSGLRGASFDVTSGSPPNSSVTAFPRFHQPTGTADDHWNGFRTLTDGQIRALAEGIVSEVEARGPFLSLAEFVNRRVSNDNAGLKGAIQTAIDNGGLNSGALYDNLQTNAGYPAQSRNNINPARTGVGIPGYLTQADVLQSLAPVITVRSDTFTIRGYGEARNDAGEIIATAMCEAVVQRLPDFLDERDERYTAVDELGDINQKFGRRFGIVSFRYLSAEEMRA